MTPPAAPASKSRAHFVVADRASDSFVVLVDETDGSRRLPWVDDWDENLELMRPNEPAAVAGAVGDRPLARLGFGLPPLTILNCWALSRRSEGDHQLIDTLYLCEPLTGDGLKVPGSARWSAGEPPVADLPVELSTALEGLAQLLKMAPSQLPISNLPAFNLPGFSSVLAEVIANDPVAERHVVMPSADGFDPRQLTQKRGWCLSSVWLNEDFVVKLTQPAWMLEARFTTWLGQHLPDVVPEVLASGTFSVNGSAETPWFLQRRAALGEAAPGEPGRQQAAAEERTRNSKLSCLRSLAKIQATCLAARSELTDLGLEDRSAQSTLQELDSLWASPDLQQLAPEERERLPSLDTILRDRLRELHARGALALLCHGDLHLGNVIEATGGRQAIIDWTDAAFAWPGVDLLTLHGLKAEAPEARDELVAAYAEALSDERIIEQQNNSELVALGLSLAPIYHAISYARIQKNLPASLRWVFEGVVPHLVKMQLHEMELAR